ncbi:MAG: reverse gyrase [Desulfurococcaceae archaeon]
MRAIMPLYDSNLADCEVSYTEDSSCTNSKLSLYIEAILDNEKDFVEFFAKTTKGLTPWGAQRSWLKRLLQGENTVLIAPTGLGKTTLLLVYALYSVSKGKKVLYIVPTKPLQNQVYQRMLEYARNAGLENVKIISYNSSLSKKKRDELLNRISCCDFNVLVVTNSFLSKKYDVLSKCSYDVLLVDDVDSLLRSKKNTYNLLKLLGYTDEIIELAKKRVNILWRILTGKTMGKNVEELVKNYLSIDHELESRIQALKVKQLVVASATGRARGEVGKVLRDLLKTDITGITIYGRDVTDSYTVVSNLDELVNKVVSLVLKLGKGCILYVSPFHPYKDLIFNAVQAIKLRLSELGFNVGDADAKRIMEFVEGKMDVLVGSSIYYGSSVRGIDAPRHIRYVVFLGTPMFVVPLRNLLANMNIMARILAELYARSGDNEYKSMVTRIRKLALTLTPSEKKLIKYFLTGKLAIEALSSSQKLQSISAEVKEIYERVLKAVISLLGNERIINVGTISLVKKSNEEYIGVLPDVMTYIQASGRTSRFIGNTITHGLSVVLELLDLVNVVKALEAKMKGFNKDLLFVELENLDLEQEARLISISRSEASQNRLKYRSILLVVESPTKAKTIARFFGKPVSRKIGDLRVYTIPAKVDNEVVEFNIVSTRGHVYDLTTKPLGLYGVLVNESRIIPVYTTLKKCKLCGTQFTDHDACPKCGSSIFTDSKSVIAALQKLALEVDEVYISTDPDIEGEKIAYDVYTSIRMFNHSVKRIELHEITLNELLKALGKPREININLVEAEIYRRILDRLVGFGLSGKLQAMFNSKNLGAGRVQTPVLGLIIERYKEHLANKCKKVVVNVEDPVKVRVSMCIEAPHVELVNTLKSTNEVVFMKVHETVEEVAPRPPYTTDELLVDASRLGYTAREAMRIAQDLYESGLITYHRTDCTYVSSHGISIAKEYLGSKGYISLFKPSHWGNQGSHEAIRPVYPLDVEDLLKAIDEGLVTTIIPLTSKHLKIYDLVFRRFIASQMKPFKAVKSEYSVYVSGVEIGRISFYTEIIEPGFNVVVGLRVYNELRHLDKFTASKFSIQLSNSSKVPLYSEGDVVALMKKLGIGRPSTYAKIIENIKRHGYVIESAKLKKLVPTKKGIQVYDYLSKNYSEVTTVELTRRMENTIDRIASGEVSGYDAIVELLDRLFAMNIIERSLLSLNLDHNVWFYPTSNNVASN